MRIILGLCCSILCFLLATIACEQQPYRDGGVLYENYCANCHMENGSGLKGLIPPLADADYLKNNQDKIACIIRKGMQGEILVNGKVYDEMMLAIPQLSDFEITNIVNYINHAWGNEFGFMKIDVIQEQLKACE